MIPLIRDIDLSLETQQQNLSVVAGESFAFFSTIHNSGQFSAGVVECELSLPSQAWKTYFQPQTECKPNEPIKGNKIVCIYKNVESVYNSSLAFAIPSSHVSDLDKKLNFTLKCLASEGRFLNNKVDFGVVVSAKAHLSLQLLQAVQNPVPFAKKFSLVAQVNNTGPSDAGVTCELKWRPGIKDKLRARVTPSLKEATCEYNSTGMSHKCRLGTFPPQSSQQITVQADKFVDWDLQADHLAFNISCASSLPPAEALLPVDIVFKQGGGVDDDEDDEDKKKLSRSQMYFVVAVVAVIAVVVVVGMWWRFRQERKGWGTLIATTNSINMRDTSELEMERD